MMVVTGEDHVAKDADPAVEVARHDDELVLESVREFVFTVSSIVALHRQRNLLHLLSTLLRHHGDLPLAAGDRIPACKQSSARARADVRRRDTNHKCALDI